MTPDEDAEKSIERDRPGQSWKCNEWFAWCTQVTQRDYTRARLGVVPAEHRDCVRGRLNQWAVQHNRCVSASDN